AYREHDDGIGRRRLLGRGGRGSTRGRDDVDREASQFACGRGKPIGLALRRTILKGDGLTFDIAELAQPLPEVVPYGCVVDDADPWNLGCALLGARGERPRGGTGEERDERAAPYPVHSGASGNPGSAARGPGPSIRGGRTAVRLSALDPSTTSSAIASTPGGILRPSVFAVLRLITRSNLVGCSIGRSAVLAPLRFFPVWAPPCRYPSVR